ncbi:SCO family protein [Nocardioides marmoribigeumensis]|uniref:Protein SCO1/2 n=1 Tax=Nocardioides marmoribigeumensis TaxID=433649 RepID=A0ABU2BRG0_9ACTN|nr:SCO family protein [Nocardioides marmoribigeumensis]MDR7361235.1 protein SCO1/2 [Nocardioides marmoribigeumensis]
MPERLRRAAGAAVLALVLPLAACGGSSGAADDPARADDGLYGAVLDQPYTVPSIPLEDTAGRTEPLSARFDKPLTLVFFGYTHCPDICIAVMSDLASTMARLSEKQAQQVRVLFVTTDPARDDTATLRAYLDRFDPSFEGLTGPLPDLVRAGDAFHVAIETGKRLPTGGYEVTHSTPVLGVVPGSSGDRASVRVVWTEGTSAAKLAADVQDALADPDLLEPA